MNAVNDSSVSSSQTIAWTDLHRRHLILELVHHEKRHRIFTVVGFVSLILVFSAVFYIWWVIANASSNREIFMGLFERFYLLALGFCAFPFVFGPILSSRKGRHLRDDLAASGPTQIQGAVRRVRAFRGGRGRLGGTDVWVEREIFTLGIRSGIDDFGRLKPSLIKVGDPIQIIYAPRSRTIFDVKHFAIDHAQDPDEVEKINDCINRAYNKLSGEVLSKYGMHRE